MELNKIFSSNMVFAANKPIRIYGEGCGKVTIDFAGQTKSGIFNDKNWDIEFSAMTYGGPYKMKVTFEDREILFSNIYIGEVYLFAGQSNMQFKIYESSLPPEQYFENEKLRLFAARKVKNNDFFSPDDGWITCKKAEVKHWSAIGSLVGNEIAKKKDIAVGIITCAQGASVIESWVPQDAFKKHNIDIPIENRHPDHVFEEFTKWNGDGILYNFMLRQIIPYSLTGVIWYQGESDTTIDEALVYADELKALIHIWRNDFKDEELPFVIVQIADYNKRADDGWRLVQKAQLDIQTMTRNVKTVISADVCENDDIHPKTKSHLSKRIADLLMQT
ncbi:MAG: hypothetical protein IJW55_06765 [Clostridia bacterium]|nr:hypothetical protein [Clostridia bacterium]